MQTKLINSIKTLFYNAFKVFKPKSFKKKLHITHISFLSGYRAAIDCLKDFEEKGVRPTYNNIRKEFEYTYDRLVKEYSNTQQGD